MKVLYQNQKDIREKPNTKNPKTLNHFIFSNSLRLENYSGRKHHLKDFINYQEFEPPQSNTKLKNIQILEIFSNFHNKYQNQFYFDQIEVHKHFLVCQSNVKESDLFFLIQRSDFSFSVYTFNEFPNFKVIKKFSLTKRSTKHTHLEK